MCPDRELLSAYHDGEVPSPWKETISGHIASCRDCSAFLESLQGLSARLSSAGTVSDSDRRMASVYARVEAHETARKRSVLSFRLSVPVPLAAAAALALTFGLGVFVSRTGARPDLAAKSTSRIPDVAAQTAVIPVSTEALQLLDAASGKQIEINIRVQLPDSSTLSVIGDPEIIVQPVSSGGR